MCKKKASLCTALFAVAITIILALSSLLKNYRFGIDCFHLIVYLAALLWFNQLVGKFYKWLRAEN